jgi:hypothetical protein
LAAKTWYYYYIKAKNSAGGSDYSEFTGNGESAKTESGISTPGVPTGVSATALSSSSIQVTWTAPYSGSPQWYRIYRSTSMLGTYTVAGETYGDTTSWTNNWLSPNTTYYYKVSAYNQEDGAYGEEFESARSITTGYAKTSAGPVVPGTPTNVSASAQSSSSIRISWSASSGSTPAYYNIWRSSSSSGTYTEVGYVSGTTLSYTDTGLNASSTYYYRVDAENSSGGRSLQSTAVSATTSAPAATVNFSIQNSSTSNIEIQIYLQGDYLSQMVWASVAPNATVTFNNCPTGSYRVQARTVSPQGSWYYNPSGTGYTSLMGGNVSYSFTGTQMTRL